jgi:hypothetical protein
MQCLKESIASFFAGCILTLIGFCLIAFIILTLPIIFSSEKLRKQKFDKEKQLKVIIVE